MVIHTNVLDRNIGGTILISHPLLPTLSHNPPGLMRYTYPYPIVQTPQ